MRTTFVITSSKELVSAVRPRLEPHALTIGTQVVLRHPYLTEYGIVPQGAKGFIEYIDEASGRVEVLMEGMEPALFHWGNTLVLSPFTCEDLLACIRLPIDNPSPPDTSQSSEGEHEDASRT